MRDAGLVVAHEMPNRRVGRPVQVWFVAPEGTPPRLRRESPDEVEDRRRRDRVKQAQRRARLAGKTVMPEPVDRPRVYLPAPPPAWDMPAEPACQTADPGLFFGADLETPQARAVRVAAAKVVCSACPVRRSCLDGALARGERHGVWSGVDLEVKGSASRRAPIAVRPGAVTPGRT